jgi:prepilin-type N-terminal cleavage/methylation domain-containing protein
MNKVKAFTLVEVSVVILISGLLIASIFSIFFITNKTYLGFDKKTKNMNEWVVLDLHLSKDVYACDSMFYVNRELKLYVRDTLVIYQFADSVVVRKKEHAELKYQIKALSIDVETILPISDISPVKRLDIVFLVNAAVYRCRYKKRYGSIIYLNHGNTY